MDYEIKRLTIRKKEDHEKVAEFKNVTDFDVKNQILLIETKSGSAIVPLCDSEYVVIK